MSFTDTYIRMLKRSISDLGSSLVKYKGSYYLPNAQMIFDTLLMQLSKIMALLYRTELNNEILHTMNKIYNHYRWIVSKINSNSGIFNIPSIEKLKQVREELLTLIEKIIPLFYLPDPPDIEESFEERTVKIMNAFEQIG